MLGGLIKRVLNVVVLGLALLAFFRVPLGRRTPAQHVAAVFSTPPAREAAASLAEAGRRIGERMIAEVERARAAAPAPDDKTSAK